MGQYPLVSRFMKGFFNEWPSLPRHCITWDAGTVLAHLRSLSPVQSIPMKQLRHKLVLLMFLLSGQRGQTIHLLDTRNMTLSQGCANFSIGDPIKTTRPGRHIEELRFQAYALDRRLCVHTALTVYLERTLNLRGLESRLQISLKKKPTRPSTETPLGAG